ncbi:MAG: ferredoxin [Solirubrobacterales bacterium]
MRVSVDRELCEANGQCEIVADDLFRLADDGTISWVESPSEDRRDDVLAAVEACPARAISCEER